MLGRRSATILLVGRREFGGPMLRGRENRDIKFESTGPVLGPKTSPA